MIFMKYIITGFGFGVGCAFAFIGFKLTMALVKYGLEKLDELMEEDDEETDSYDTVSNVDVCEDDGK